MIDVRDFVNSLIKMNIDFVTGVPDSLLKNVCAYISEKWEQDKHIIATNEGSAIGLAIGHFLSTKKPALVYLQNSGLGNVINPITSLADQMVYGIPMILMIGWRGEIMSDGIQLKDEPQHVKQGLITAKQLEILEIPYQVIKPETENIYEIIKDLREKTLSMSRPVALLVRKGTFSKYELIKKTQDMKLPSREEIIAYLINVLPEKYPIVSTTGFTSREVFESRKKFNQGHSRDFLTVGGMGHASQIAVGIAKSNSLRKVLCIDGDGALLMHSGSLAISSECNNLIHVLINNEAHDSVGGQPTKGDVLKFHEIARSFGYQNCYFYNSLDQLKNEFPSILIKNKSVFVEIKCRIGARNNLGRPDRTPAENKFEFMKFLEKE